MRISDQKLLAWHYLYRLLYINSYCPIVTGYDGNFYVDEKDHCIYINKKRIRISNVNKDINIIIETWADNDFKKTIELDYLSDEFLEEKILEYLEDDLPEWLSKMITDSKRVIRRLENAREKRNGSRG